MKKGIIEIFKEIPDPRVGNTKKYKLEEILVIAILAINCDYLQFIEMELFGYEQEEAEKSFNRSINLKRKKCSLSCVSF